jgi:hypothetical protein
MKNFKVLITSWILQIMILYGEIPCGSHYDKCCVIELNQIDSNKIRSPWNLLNRFIHDEYTIGHKSNKCQESIFEKRFFILILQFSNLPQIIVRFGLFIVNYLGLITNWDFWNHNFFLGYIFFQEKVKRWKRMLPMTRNYASLIISF